MQCLLVGDLIPGAGGPTTSARQQHWTAFELLSDAFDSDSFTQDRLGYHSLSAMRRWVRDVKASFVDRKERQRPVSVQSMGDQHTTSWKKSPVNEGGPSPFAQAHHFTIQSMQAADVQTLQYQVFNGRPSGAELLAKNTSYNALFDASVRFDAPRCDEDTRVGLLEEVRNWIENGPPDQKVLCITGLAGTGKSALLQTTAERHAGARLPLSSWFFRTNDSSRNTKANLVATIAYQIGVAYPELQDAMHAAIERDPSIFDKSLERQIEALVLDPWEAVFTEKSVTPSPQWHVIVIDGVDECDGEENQYHVLAAFARRLTYKWLPFKIIFASRPEVPVQTALAPEGCLHEVGAYHIRLHDHDATGDIRNFLARRLHAIRKNNLDPLVASAEDWPSKGQINHLASIASGQFIYAHTVLKYLSNPRRSPIIGLEEVIGWRAIENPPERPFASLDTLYSNILNTAQAAQPDEATAIVRLVHIVATMPASTVATLEEFFRFSPGYIRRAFADLHSLITFHYPPGQEYDPSIARIMMPHRSLLDFLDDPRRSGPLHIPRCSIHLEFALACMEWIYTATKDDIIYVWMNSWIVSNSPTRESLTKWTNHLVRCIPEVNDNVTSVPVPCDTKLLQTFLEFSRRGVWKRFAECLEDPRMAVCRCQNEYWTNDVVTDLANDLRNFYEYVEAHFPLLNSRSKGDWAACFVEVKAFEDALWQFRRKPCLEGRHCGSCLGYFQSEEYRENAKAILAAKSFVAYEDMRTRDWNYFV